MRRIMADVLGWGCVVGNGECVSPLWGISSTTRSPSLHDVHIKFHFIPSHSIPLHTQTHPLTHNPSNPLIPPPHARSNVKNAKCPPTTGLAKKYGPGNPPSPSVTYRSVNGLSVTVSLSHTATRSRISERTFLDATAAASNSQSDFVYR